MPDSLTWHKSSYCAQGNSCVHVAVSADRILVAESGDSTGAVLTTGLPQWNAFVLGVRADEFGHVAPATGIYSQRSGLQAGGEANLPV
ncbi:DUF397 domain-containing protein [Streptomyces sp. NPDC050145]|uniref:DUF397 domain-containing protein n=1 Tax=Streptomyces sp. NPDC050145 TaxID=3365602 RepID=UPI003796E3A1